MALNATIHKVTLQVAHTDRGHYADHALTIARHPSETEERLMVRVLVFAFHAHEDLVLCKGISSDEEPDLWRKDATGRVLEWIEVGLPDEKRLRKAAGVADAVFLYTYGGRGADVWWRQNQAALARLSNLTVIDLPYEATQALARIAGRNMRLQCTVQEGTAWFSDGTTNITIEPAVRQQPAGR